jgi:hypothetical protein
MELLQHELMHIMLIKKPGAYYTIIFVCFLLGAFGILQVPTSV